TFDSLTVVPLGLKTAKDGWISFKATDMENMPSGLYVYLSDIRTGVMHDLRNASTYRLYLASGDYPGRFFLNFSTKELASPGGAVSAPFNGGFKAYSAGGRLYVNAGLPSGEKGEFRVINMLGQVVLREEIGGNAYQPVNSNFTPGIYVVSFASPGGIQTKKIFITAP
ncbi:MAG TPA: T9SS type A sorting domain-containing protein, partial [Puia sp.]|nr:T9SS type A sorting domain-containing protein [Puia sp.]